jgi:DNA invertase Pin-like site-specific DNA recombinase
MKSAVIYHRYTIPGQKPESIEHLLMACREFAKANGYTVVGEYIDHAGSGMTVNRPMFQRMISDRQSKDFQTVIVSHYDHFSRSHYDSAIYKTKLRENGIRVLAVYEISADDPCSMLVESMIASMYEYYSREQSLKIRRGIALKKMKMSAKGGNTE